jgi:hypothetical protein
VIRRRGLLPVLLLGLCGMAGGQTAPPSVKTAAAPLAQAATTPSPAGDSGKSTAVSVSVAPLSPQEQRLLDEADQLVGLAQELKAEVDKTDQYTLSVKTLRRADDIEKLAKTLQKEVQREGR